MPVSYELRLATQTIKGTSSPVGRDGLISKIRIDAPTSIYLSIQTHEIFATAEMEGNLEIFTFDHATLIIENYFTIASGSRIYVLNDNDVHAYTEYTVFIEGENSTNGGREIETSSEDSATPMEVITELIDSAQKSSQDAKITKQLAEQAIYKEFFKKDNFSSGQYKISYDQGTKTYAANNIDIDFLEIAKKNLEATENDLDDSNDMAPEICFQMLDNAIESMASDRISKMLFWEDGNRTHSSFLLDNKGTWNASAGFSTGKNYLQVGSHYDSNYNFHDDPVPLFSALEILDARERKKDAVLRFEKSHGSENELIFNLRNAAYEAETKNIFSKDQRSFISEMSPKKSIDAEKTMGTIKNLFPDSEKTASIYGTDFEESLGLLKNYATLKWQEKLAKSAFNRVDEFTGVHLSRFEVATHSHLNIIKEKEINAQHYRYVTQMSKTIDKIKEIELSFLRQNADENHQSYDQDVGNISAEIAPQPHRDDGTENTDDAGHVVLTGLMPPQDSIEFGPR